MTINYGERSFLLLSLNFANKVIMYTLKGIQCQCMILLSTCFLRGVLDTSYTIQTIAIALVFPLELNNKPLLLKTLLMFTVHGEIKLVLTRKFLPAG